MDPAQNPESTSSDPAFGRADLSNCEREQIHLAGSIQPHGALLVASEPDLTIRQTSANAPELLDLPDNVLGKSLTSLDGNLAERVKGHLSAQLDEIPVAVRCRIGRNGNLFDCLIHRPPGDGLVIEAERAGDPVDLSDRLETSLKRILNASSLPDLCDEAADIFKDFVGYDRVMVYRFDPDGHGAVFSEKKEPDLEPFLGNRYPASDIPQIARRLYEINRIRVLVDVNYEPVPLLMEEGQAGDASLDMSLSFLRSMSPIHIQYLKNMGVGATLVASLMVAGKLWGLIACHHYRPRFIHYEMRAVCEVLAEAIATRIAGFESFARAQSEAAVRRMEQRMISAITRRGDWHSALFDPPTALLETVNASGAALLFEGQTLTTGEVPGTHKLRDIAAWLDERRDGSVFETACLGEVLPDFQPLKAVASGLIATPVSDTPGEYLIWFRPEQIRTVTWGGNPFKPVEVGNDPADLSPRRSFSQWHQVVEGTAERWRPADRAAVRMIGASVRDVVIQFRSVRALIARDQLAQVCEQVRASELPVVVVDAEGAAFLVSQSFRDMTGARGEDIRTVGDLPGLFEDPEQLAWRFREMMSDRRSWRGEVQVKSALGHAAPLLVRTDPVYTSKDQVLGFVILFIDLSARKAAEDARRRFQATIIDRTRKLNGRLENEEDLVYRNLMSSIVENAQLAALDVADGVDPERMPDVLESIELSIKRAADLLSHLVEHAADLDAG